MTLTLIFLSSDIAFICKKPYKSAKACVWLEFFYFPFYKSVPAGQLGGTLLEKGSKNGYAVLQSNRGNGYSIPSRPPS